MKYIKIILVTGLLFCLVDMPYGYYTLIRLASAIIFGIVAVTVYGEEKLSWAIGYATVAILFQPFLKIALGREIWQIVDIIAAILLIVSMIKTPRKE